MSETAVPDRVGETMVDVTPDGGVRKVVLQEGTGELPPKHARCLVHYEGRLAESGEVFMDTRGESTAQEPVHLVAGRDSLSREVGLHVAVSSMRRGERARLEVSHEYGYGATGSFSYPAVPPAAQLTYELELLDWEEADEGREARSMTYEERLEAAERRRIAGNALFAEGQHAEALTKYRLALSFLDEELLMQLEGPHLEKAHAVRVPAFLNAAACHLRLGDNNAAIGACSEALAMEPGSAKALFRRGRARAALGQTEAAAEDLRRAREAAPGDAGIARELAAVRQTVKQEKEAQGQIFKGFFDKEGCSSGLYADDSQAWEGPSQSIGAVAGQSVGWWHGLLSWLGAGLRALLPAFFRESSKDHSQ